MQRYTSCAIPCVLLPILKTCSGALRRMARRSNIRMDAGALDAQIRSTVADNKIVVYSKSYCPFCMQTKSLFDKIGVEYKVVELDEVDNGAAIQEALLGITQQRTVPNVFVGGEHVGGNDDTQRAAASGKLQELLAK